MASILGPTSWSWPTRRIASLGVSAALVTLLWVVVPRSMALAQDEPPGSPQATPTERSVHLDEGSRPVRVQVPHFDIDLPVVWSGRKVPGNPTGYPLCDVVQYLVDRDRGLSLPGQPGTSWLYGHAQPGMLLPLTLSYFRSGGDELMGQLMKLQLRDGRLLTYRIVAVEAGFGYDIAERPRDRQQRLVLQTSTGSSGASPRLLVAGRLVGAEWTDEPQPEPRPRACWQEPQRTPRNTPKSPASPEPPSAPVIEPDASPDALTLVLGSGAILLGAAVVAVYLVRRP